MKTAFIIEGIVLAVTWTELHRKIFPKSRINTPVFRIFHIILIAICSCGIGITGGKQFLPFICVCVSGTLNGVMPKRTLSKNIVESMFTYLITKMMWAVSLLLSFFLLIFINPLKNDILSGICASVIQTVLCFVFLRCVNSDYWKLTTNRHYTKIMITFGILFITSYSVLADRRFEEHYALGIYALVVLALFGTILFMWAKDTREQQKIEEDQSKHIEELVRRAHKYKSVIPAVERDLWMEQKRLLKEHRWEAAAEVGCALDEVSTLRRETSADSMREMLEASFSTTGLLLLDSQLQGAREDGAELGVVLDCVVTEPAADLVKQGLLGQFQLQQMVGDLVDNALRAVRLQKGEDKRVLLILGETREGYQIRICDTGLPFPVEILREFGKRGLTTGGTGHGLADLCEIMAACGGSIRVEEYGEGAFTKAISLTMDGRVTLSVHSALTGIDYERSLVQALAGEGV